MDATQQTKPPTPRLLVYHFGGFTFDSARGSLSGAAGEAVNLRPKAAEVLRYLADRAGRVVPREELMEAVWGDVFVTDDSITQCVTEIRRTLGEKGARLLQTLPKRGYLLATEVTQSEACFTVGAVEIAAPPTPQTAGDNKAAELPPELPAEPVRFVVRAASFVLLLCAAAAGWVYWDQLIVRSKSPQATAQSIAIEKVGLANAPRLSVVVLPFANLGGLDDETVDGLTEDLTTTVGAVIARDAAFTYRAKSTDIRQVAQELGVRYAVEGSARRNGDAMRVSVQLVSTETGAHILVDQFDIRRDGVGYNVDDVVRQIAAALYGRLLDVESERSLRERPENSDVDDLVIRARAMRRRNFSPQTQGQVLALFERAVALDPSSVSALSGLADAMLENISNMRDDPTAPPKLRRAEDLITKAEQLRPDDPWVLWDRVYLLAKAGRYDEVIPAAEKAIEINPYISGPHFWLGNCLLFNGRPAEAIAEYKNALRTRVGDTYNRYAMIGYASLLMGQYDQAVTWIEKALAANPNAGPVLRGTYYAGIAAAQALGGQIKEARQSAAEAMRLWPLITVRSYWGQSNIKNAEALAQIERMRDGMRLAGIRDHADEDADFGLPSDDVLHTNYDSPTPTTVPGARTIRTSDLEKLLQESKPLVVDAPWGKSIPGAVGLWGAGIGGSLSDEYQDRLGRKMQQLTHGDRALPIVTMGSNSELYQGRNLALRLVALGYTNVYWYRGGRDAWEAAALPETELALQDW